MSMQVVKNLQRFEHVALMPLAVSKTHRLKVFIPYDGSELSDAVLDHLKRAGLPKGLEAVVAVTQLSLPLSPEEITRAVIARRMKLLTSGISSFVPALKDYEEQTALSLSAEQRIRSMFPSGNVKTEGLKGVAAIARELISRAKSCGAELIMIGAQASPSPQITDYAGAALRVAQDAHCSVRVVRASNRTDDSPVRIIAVVDQADSTDSVAEAVASRVWPIGSEARLIGVRKPGWQDQSAAENITLTLQRAAQRLQPTGLETSIVVKDGQPEEELFQEARTVAADCMFIAAHGLSHGDEDRGLSKLAEALLLGAPCSVEVVRNPNSSRAPLKAAA
jgi:nucleotide-binding universal stress UspA family protein